ISARPTAMRFLPGARDPPIAIPQKPSCRRQTTFPGQAFAIRQTEAVGAVRIHHHNLNLLALDSARFSFRNVPIEESTMENQFHRWLLALLAWSLLPLCGMACDCPYYGAPCKAFANTPTVFAGRVVKICPGVKKLVVPAAQRTNLTSSAG